MSKYLKPLGDRILVKALSTPQMTKAGIIIPQVKGQITYQGEVVEVGPGTILPDGTVRPVGLAKGDIVVYTMQAGVSISVDTQDLLILHEVEILGKFEEMEN